LKGFGGHLRNITKGDTDKEGYSSGEGPDPSNNLKASIPGKDESVHAPAAQLKKPP